MQRRQDGAELRGLGFEPGRIMGARGFTRIAAIADGVEAVYTSDESKRRFEILARQVFLRFKALVMEPSAFLYAEHHDNIEAIYKKLEERRDLADVSDLLKELHRIVNEAIRAAAQRHSLPYLFDQTRISVGELGPGAVALGAATLPVARLLAAGGLNAG